MQKTLITLTALLSFAAQATPEHDVKPPKVTKSARSAATASTGPIGITNAVQSSVAPVFGGTSAFGGSLNLAGAQFGTQERSAPPVSVAAPQQPLTSCRLGLSGGGSNSSGALGFGLVMGNDATCLVGAKLAVMDRVGGFSADERQQVACEIEGMEKLETCKRIAQKAPQVARVETLLP